jgi:tetratricopeptide (TPR) repeat protein
MDQLHFWWSSEASALPALQRAAQLNPDDSSIQVRLARAEQLAGQRDAALASMQRAATLNPASLALQESYGRSLIEAGRNADAYAQFQKIITRWPRNADALVDYGMLAYRLGHDEEAVDNWQRAVDVDPGQANAQLYLAQVLDQQGALQAAARHYRMYLEIVSARHSKSAADTGPVLAAFIKVADADAAIHHNSDASKGYMAAAGFAEKAGEKTLESLALVHLADLQEKEGDIRGAAQSYQRALQLDATLSDPRSTASDWFNYAQFLRKQHQPEGYVFAGLLHAENVLQNTPGDELTVVSQARKESEARLGVESGVVRRKLDEIVAESLTLQISALAAKQ